jgi:hypothetical protein
LRGVSRKINIYLFLRAGVPGKVDTIEAFTGKDRADPPFLLSGLIL